MRRTHRRYSDRAVPDALVRLLLAAAFSASSKSDFQQASALWLRGPRPARPARRAVSRHALDRQRAGVSRLSRRCPAARPARRVARQAAGQRRARRVFQRDGGRGAGVADLHPGRRDAGARHLPDQRPAQPDRRGRRDSRTARQGVPGRRAVPRLSGAARLYQHAPAARRRPCISTATTIPGWQQAVDGYDRRRDARHSIKDRQRDPARFGTAEFYGWSEDKARQAATPEGAGFAAWLKAHGFSLDEP